MQFLIDNNVTLTYTPTVFEPFTDREVIPGGGSVALAPYLLEQMQASYNQSINTKSDSLSLISFKKEMKRVVKYDVCLEILLMGFIYIIKYQHILYTYL